MDVFCPISEDPDSRSTDPDSVPVSLLGIRPELALSGEIIATRLQDVTLEEVTGIVDRHLWTKFHSGLDSSTENPQLSLLERQHVLAAMGVELDREPAKRRINKSILFGDWDRIIEIMVAKFNKLNKSLGAEEPTTFIESKDTWYARYRHRQSVITFEYAKLVSARIIRQGWKDIGISPAEFIYVAKPLSEIAANNAGYFKASNAAKSSIPILGSLVSDNWYGATVKELFLAPYLEEYQRLEKLSGRRIF